MLTYSRLYAKWYLNSQPYGTAHIVSSSYLDITYMYQIESMHLILLLTYEVFSQQCFLFAIIHI